MDTSSSNPLETQTPTPKRRWGIAVLLLLVVGLAIFLVFGLGDPVGLPIGQNPFTVEQQRVSVRLVATRSDYRLKSLADFSEDCVVRLSAWMGEEPPKILVRIFTDRQEYVAYCTAYVSGFVPTMDFCYSRTDRSVYAFLRDVRQMRPRLRHELFHALVHVQKPSMALWVEEGIAELLEQTDLSELTAKWTGPQSIQEAWIRLARDAKSQPSQLPTVDVATFYGENTMQWYGLSYATTLAMARAGTLPVALGGKAIEMVPDRFRIFVNDTSAWTQVDRLMAQEATSPAAGNWVLATASK